MCKKRSSLPLSRHWLRLWYLVWLHWATRGRCGLTRGDKTSAARHRLGLSCEWLKWTAALVTALGPLKSGAQTTPSTIPNKTWASEVVSSWFTAANWNPNGVPAAADDVGIGSGSTALIEDEVAVARTVTLGVVNGGTYTPGQLEVIGETLTITPPTGTLNPGLQVLSESTLTIGGEGAVNLGTFTVENFGQINVGADGSGGTLNAGTVTNRNSGSINGGLTFEGAGTVTNAGQISGLVFSGVTVGAGIQAFDGAVTITNTNSGTISGTTGIELEDGGTVTNGAGGTITGNSRGVLSPTVLPESGISEQAAAIAAQAADPPAVIVTNSGTISGATGVEIDTGGSVTNNAGGIIRGIGGEGAGDGIGVAALPNSGVTPEPLAVANSGTISGTNAAIDLEGGGSITNNSGASIVAGAGNPAVIANGGPLTFLNAGTITGNVTLETLPGTAAGFANQATLVTGGTIAGDLNLGTNPGTILTLDGSGTEALSKAVTGLITNAGSVIKQGTGTWVIDKSVGNNPGGTTVESGTLIDALTNALGTGPIDVTDNSSLLQVSQGVEIANPTLITITDGGSIDNAGTISTPPGGLISGTGGGNVTNEETGIIINTAGNAVIFNAGGNLTNLAGALIQSNTASGVFSTGGQITVTNSGTISGLFGINPTGGGSVTNDADGIITGTSRGVLSPIELPDTGIPDQTAAIAAQAVEPPALTVVNSGTISGATGVEIDTGGSVTNNAGGVIQGTGGEGTGDGIGVAALPNSGEGPAPLAVANSGIISGTTTGIDLEGGGSITNNSGASIVAGAGNPAIIANGGPLIFLNAGTITGSVIFDTVPGTAASFANQATLVTGGTIAGDLNLGTNPGTILTLAGSGTENLSKAVTGLITNGGSVIKQGTGTWVIDKSLGNTPGGTTVESGTLIDALTNALGTGPITVTGNTSLLQVSQGVGIANPSLVTVSGGGSIDNAGTISAPAGGLISGAGGGNVTNEGTGIIINTAGNAVTFNAGGDLTNLAGGLIQSDTASGVFSTGGQITITNSGTISGLGGINLTGGGSVINNVGGVISGRNGLAILSAGGPVKFSNAGTINGNVLLGNFANTVQLFSGSRINGSLNLGNSAASNLILDGSTDQSLSQAISGTSTNAGSLTKQGSGNWTVDVAMSAPVSTNILAGVLTVNSSLSSPLVTVQAGGMLKGTGNVLGNVVNLGTISPGNSPGTLTINGNFTQGPSGIYNVEIISPQNYSRLVVTGHASLDGTLHLTLASGFRIAPGETFTVLTAGQGISGTFRTISGNTPVNVTYANGTVLVNAASTTKVQASDIHLSDGTPISTTALLADYTFYGFGSLSERMALGLIPLEDTSKQDAISLTFDAGEFDIQGQHGQTYTIPIAGGFKINDRVRLDYEIPLQYITLDNTSLFQAGLTLDLPVKVIIPTANQPWSWIVTPTAAVATSGSKEIIGGGALTNVFSYQWHGITATYGNYISFFEGDLLTSDDPKFPSGVSQQIMKNGLRLDVPVAKSWIVEAYGIYTQFFQPAAVSSYWTFGVEVGHHFTWDIEGRHLDLGYLSLGLYTEIGNQYNQYHSGHAQIGSAWRF